MDTRYVDDLCDRTDWIACSIELQSSNDDLVHAALGRIGELQERIDERSREDVVPFQTLTTPEPSPQIRPNTARKIS